jgi:hypothetical protein
MIVNSTQIVALCSKLGALSSSQANLQASDFLAFSNLVISTLVGEVLGAREEYLVFQDVLPVTAGQTSYRIPYRAVNGEVRHLWFEDGSGSRFRLYAKAIEDMENYLTTSTGYPDGFYVMGNNIELMPPPNVNGTLVMAYPFRPNLLVDATTTQSVIAVDKVNNIVTVPNIPPNFINGALYDLIDHLSGNGIVHYDLVGSISGNTISFPTPIPDVAVGNYIAQAGQSPVPMIPEEGHPLLLEMTVLRTEMVRGNQARVKNSSAIIQDARKSWEALLNNRIVSKAHPAGSGGAQYPLRPY